MISNLAVVAGRPEKQGREHGWSMAGSFFELFAYNMVMKISVNMTWFFG